MEVSSVLPTRQPSHSKLFICWFLAFIRRFGNPAAWFLWSNGGSKKKCAYGVDKYFSEGTSYWKTRWHPMTPCRKLNLHTRAFVFFCSLRSQRRDPATQCMGEALNMTWNRNKSALAVRICLWMHIYQNIRGFPPWLQREKSLFVSSWKSLNRYQI